MGRSFYKDEEDQYSTPGLPTVSHIKNEANELTTATEADIKINKFGNLITTSPALESFVSKIRETTTSYYNIINEKFEFYTSTAGSHLEMTKYKILDFKGEHEDLLPNGCTVLTATLVGSIVSRNRSLPIRFVTPILFGGIALKYVLPETYANVSNGFQHVGLSLENKYFPEFKQTREDNLKKFDQFMDSACALKQNSWNGLVSCVSTTRKSILSVVDSTANEKKP